MTKEKEKKEKEKTIHQAFVLAQKGFGKALKTSTNPHFRSKYADLGACIEAVIDSLHEQGFALIQMPKPSEDGFVTIVTELLYTTGERLYFGELTIPVTKKDAQGYGSGLTYCRRYSLLTAMGIAPEADDDGNMASQRPVSKPATPKKQKAVTTYYNLTGCPDEQVKACETYLLASNAKRVSDHIFKSPIRLEKLSQFIDENFVEYTE
jgi:hypothetical protein